MNSPASQKPKRHAASRSPAKPSASTKTQPADSALASAAQGAAQAEPSEQRPIDDREAASIRAQQLRGGNRPAANQKAMRLDYPSRPGWHRCFVNDSPGNVQRFQERGYDFVVDDVSRERVSRVVGVAEGRGGGLLGFLMEIPDEIYDEDCQALERKMSGIDAQIKRGAIERKEDEDDVHVPTNPDGTPRIKIEPATRPR